MERLTKCNIRANINVSDNKLIRNTDWGVFFLVSFWGNHSGKFCHSLWLLVIFLTCDWSIRGIPKLKMTGYSPLVVLMIGGGCVTKFVRTLFIWSLNSFLSIVLGTPGWKMSENDFGVEINKPLGASVGFKFEILLEDLKESHGKFCFLP